jgi:acyl-CoA synthetase (AMP-forming)/AMP-acid ligase II
VNTNNLVGLLENAGASLLDAGLQPRPCSSYLAEARLRAERWRLEGVRRGSIVILESLRGLELLKAIFTAWSLEAVPFAGDELFEDKFSGSVFKVKGGAIEAVRAGDADCRLQGAMILHRTSGSTGRSRLVRRGGASLIAEARRYQEALSLSGNDRMLVVLPIDHSFGWGFLLGGLLAGCLIDLKSNFSPTQTAKELDRGGVTVLGLTPPMSRLLAGRPGSPSDNPPRLVVVGAGPVDEKLEEAFKSRFGIGLARNYGSTETGATFSGDAGSVSGSIGKPMTGVKVLEPSIGGRGELVLELTPPVDGYIDEQPSARWATGDLVERDTEERVRVLGRLDDRLRVNGQNLDRPRVENVLLSYPGLEEVYLLACPRPNASQVEDLVAVVKGSEVSQDELLRYCADRLPSSHCPSRIVLCDELPRTPVGKLNRDEIFRWVRNSLIR